MNIGLYWLANIGMSTHGRLWKDLAYEWILAFPAEHSMSWSFYLNFFNEMGGKWPFNCSFVRCCFENLFKTARSKFISSSMYIIKRERVRERERERERKIEWKEEKSKSVCVWYGLLLWHTNHWRLLNAESSLCIYIRYIWFVNIYLRTIYLNESALYFLTTVQ